MTQAGPPPQAPRFPEGSHPAPPSGRVSVSLQPPKRTSFPARPSRPGTGWRSALPESPSGFPSSGPKTPHTPCPISGFDSVPEARQPPASSPPPCQRLSPGSRLNWDVFNWTAPIPGGKGHLLGRGGPTALMTTFPGILSETRESTVPCPLPPLGPWGPGLRPLLI